MLWVNASKPPFFFIAAQAKIRLAPILFLTCQGIFYKTNTLFWRTQKVRLVNAAYGLKEVLNVEIRTN